MKSFNTNYSELKLLSSQKILGTINGKEFEIVPPKLLDYHNKAFVFLITMLDEDIEEIKDMIVGQQFTSHYLIFSFILAGIDKAEDVEKIGSLALSGLQLILPELVFEDKKFMLKGEFLDETSFNEIVILIFKMLKRDKIIINPDDDKFTKKEKKMKLLAQKIKRDSEKDSSKGDSIENMLAAILYEFQQYTLKDLFELNIYTIYYLFGYVGKISNYEISRIAYATGNFKKGKKLKYFIEK